MNLPELSVDELSTDVGPNLGIDDVVVDLRTGQPELSSPGEGSTKPVYETCKRIFDLVFGIVLAVLLSPLFLVLGVLVKFSSSGPAFFRQERVGRHGTPFLMIKFRTMTHGADDSTHRRHYEQLANGDRLKLLIEDDPRITSLGRFLRKWSLDELPNLWNVLKGEMSFVGPRPLVPYELMLHDREHLRRLLVKPGITGLAQVNGRLHISLDERGDFDLQYVDCRSFSRDLVLLARTVPALFTRPGA